MVDITDSVKLKNQPPGKWIKDIAETFSITRAWTSVRYLKTIGDLLMFWFPNFQTVSEPWHIFHGLAATQRLNGGKLPEVKGAFTKCQDVYDITFSADSRNDVYGKDIDLTARLIAVARRGEIIMNASFYEDLKAASGLGSAEEKNRSLFERIQGPWAQEIRGFVNPVTIFKLPKEPN